MKNDFFLIPYSTIQTILAENISSIYELIKTTYLAHEKGHTVAPGSHFLRFPDNPQARIIALPGYIANESNVAGIKWIASNPQNLLQNIPRASAVIILNNADTGRPFACLEGSLISAARTAASAVLAAEYMHPDKKIINLGIVGNGPIAMEIYRYFLATGWDIQELTLFDHHPTASQSFQNQITASAHKTIRIVDSIEKLMQTSDAIVFATTSSTPYLTDMQLIQHSPLILHISLRDLSTEILLKAHNVVDDVSHVLHANTSIHLTQQKYSHTRFIDGTLADLIQKKYQITLNKARIFSPMGLGILDIALAKYVFDKTYGSEQQFMINNFLGTT